MLTTISFNSFNLSKSTIATVTFSDSPETIFLKFSQYSNKEFCVLYDFWTPSDHLKDRITFVVHSTIDYVQYLEKHIDSWTGAISLAIFIDYPDENDFIKNTKLVLSKLETLETAKSSGIVGIHLFYRNPTNTTACGDITITTAETRGTYSDVDSIYPINVARNIARKGSKTKLFISGDIENYFVTNYEHRMRKLAMEKLINSKEKLALVHRRFEVENGLKLPKTKNELQLLYNRGKAVVFHRYFYQVGHAIPNIDAWFNHKEDLNNTSVQRIMDYPNPRWEPQFVGLNSEVPLHDESFPFRMSSNTHLCSEMCRAGFRFAIVYDLFTIHVGIKKKESPNELAVKKKVWKSGYRQIVDDFVKRLDLQYPSTKNKCPKFVP
ncbi:unnamed protein product [Bursaphelenchus xylophilus]|uniref:(pine wood nematode) hypothetical protein n=1 Tax=Bursaphelenchus xylophilus TaxID=6326 RepID=A0A1I7RRU7_BURXY|nr:unnamed protein product [Bursaphelenchus xylophilus]CAG9123464.1 unnamed protein product [Bursaphelenchus xylophilus]